MSNNRYRLGRAVGSGTRPKIDDGLLGITVLSSPSEPEEQAPLERPWREWSAPLFEVDSATRSRPDRRRGRDPHPAPPFRDHAGALRVRIARPTRAPRPRRRSRHGRRHCSGTFAIAAGRDRALAPDPASLTIP